MGWSANKTDPSARETNGLILLRRQRGEAREKTLAYLNSITDAGFKPNGDTLVSLLHTDPLTLEDFNALAQQLHVDLSSKSSADAWRVLFRNFMFDKLGTTKNEMLEQVLDLHDRLPTEGYNIPYDVMLPALRQASITELPNATAVLDAIHQERPTFGEPPGPWWTTLLAAHMHVAFANDTRAKAVCKVYDILHRSGEELFEDVAVHEAVKAAWLAGNHSDAAMAIKEYFSTPDAQVHDFLAAWTILWRTRWRGSYVPTSAVLLEGHAFARDRFDLAGSILVPAIEGYTVAVSKLRSRRRQDNKFLETDEVQAVLDGATDLASAANTLLGTRRDCHPARAAVVRLIGAKGDAHGLLQQWDLICRHPADLDQALLADVFRFCAKERALPVARDIMRTIRNTWPLSRPSPPVWAAYVACLAECDALSAAVVCAKEQLAGHPDEYAALLPVLTCAQRLGVLDKTKGYLNENIPEVYRHPQVLRVASQLRRGAKAANESSVEYVLQLP